MRGQAISTICHVLAAMVITASCPAANSVPRINNEMAARLASEAVGWTLKYIDFDEQDHDFFVFAALGGEYGTAPAAWVGVNQWTGDAWDLWMCRRLSSPALRKSQAAIRRHFHRDALRQYTRLRKLHPVCYGP
jgi:hypothetical protein